MIARPRCPDRKRTAPCRPTNRKKAPAPESKKAPPSASKEAPPFPSKKAPAFAAFISYAKDDFEKAQEIADQLEEHDFKCWIAPRDVRPGRSYGDLIIKGIERAQSFILVLSSASNNSGFVSREIERAVSKNKHIFTVRVEDVQGRRRRSSCSSPRRNGSMPSRGGWRPHIDQLAQQLADDDDVATPEDWRPPTRTSASRPPWRSPYVLGGGAAVLAALALGAFFLTRPTGDFTLEREACMNLSGAAGIAACDRAIASGKFSGSDAAYLLARRGYERQARNDLAGALADYSEAIRLDPRLAMAFNNRGNIYRDQGDYDRALADYDRALALDPAKPDPLASRGWVLSQKGEDERARQDFEKALALDPAPELKQKLEAALIAGDKDFQACDDEQGETAIAACGRAIASGRYSGEVLASHPHRRPRPGSGALAPGLHPGVNWDIDNPGIEERSHA